MRSSIVLWVAVLLMAAGAVAGEYSADFELYLADHQQDEMVGAIVTMTDQVDLEALKQELYARHADRREWHEAVVLALQEMATNTQPDILAQLEDLASQGMVEKYGGFWISNIVLVNCTKEALDILVARNDVEGIFPDYQVENIEPVSKGDDVPTITGVENGLIAIRADEVWAMGITGEGRLVSHLDTGVDGNHPALNSRWRGLDSRYENNPEWAWFDSISHTQFPQDWGSHGTHTMGTICGLGENTGDTIGVAFGAEWISAGVIDRQSIPRTVGDAIGAFEWTADPDGDPGTVWDVPDVSSNSWGVTTGHGYPPCDETFWTVLDGCEAAGVVVVFAAGNEGSGPSTLRRPADRATTDLTSFSVGALDGNNNNYPIAGFSSRGPSNCTPDGQPTIKPEVSAPGVNVRSSVPGGGYAGGWSGTSMACPHVAGVVALMRQANPNLTSEQVREIMLDTAIDLGAEGEDNAYGMGMVDAYECVIIALAYLEGWGTMAGYVTDQSSGDPLQGAIVSVLDRQWSATTNGAGFYRLLAPADTLWDIKVEAAYYLPEFDEVMLVENETTFVDYVLQNVPSGSLHGTVTNTDDGSPIAGASVEAVGVPVDPVQTDGDGYYEFVALPGDITHQIRVRASGFSVGEGEIFVPIGGDAELDFELSPFESFENDNGGWVGESIWEWGVPTSGPGVAFDGRNVWATVLGGEYPNNADAGVVTISYLIEESSAAMSFYQWYDIESGYDGGNVSISVDGGSNWDVIHPDGGYPDDTINGLDGDPGFTGTSDWALANFDVGSYINSVVSFRFRFGTDGSVTMDGWYLDAFVVTGATPTQGGDDPDITVDPASYHVTLEQGQSAERTLTIGNIGEGLLYYSITPIVMDRRLWDDDPPEDYVDPLKLDPNWGKYLNYERNGEMLTVTYDGPKSETSGNNNGNPPVIADYGGPDEFGYTWIDSDEPNGPEFNWIDITGIGEPLTFIDDDNQGPFPLGFDMPFYGNFFGSINICSNGWISFTSTGITWINSSIPTSGEPNNLVAPFWDDLDPSEGGMIYFYTNNVDTAIVSWVDVPHYDFTGIGLYTFEAIILADGNIVYQYASVDGELLSNTVGIENEDGSIGLEVVFDGSYVTDGLAVQINLPIFWLDVDPRSGYNEPDESSEFTVSFDASELDLGEYLGFLRIDSNDPDDPIIAVECTLVVEDPTGIDDLTENIPTAFALDQNYPNPFNPSTDISFALPSQSDVELSVYDMLGRQVKTLVNEKMRAGYHTVVWDGSDNSGQMVSSGIYFYSIKAGEFTQNRKMLMLK